MEIKKIHELFLRCSSLVIDTRKINANTFFVALRGEKFDANTFALEALNKGAAYVLIDDDNFFIDERTIVVNDSLSTLQQLASYHRKFLNLPIIALTGSNGKTTTKELLNRVLSKKFNVKATVGNLNNHIGVPLTLLSFDSSTEIGIVEMGANHKKEIDFLCAVASPDYGYITNFGKAHLEGFGGVDGVIKGKSEMYQYLRENNKTVFVNLDDAIQVEKTSSIKQFTFGVNNEHADVNILNIEINPMVVITFADVAIQSNLIGIYNANNINASIAVGVYFGVGPAEIKNALENYIPENNRSQMITKGSLKIILDAYNANPSSMVAAIDNFSVLHDDNKIMLLGDMFELGDESPYEHNALVDKVAQLSSVQTFFIGKEFYAFHRESPNMTFYETFDEAFESLQDKSVEDAIILIKGSRGMALERLLEILG